MSLTPLHYLRKDNYGIAKVEYGLSFYTTDCGRFMLYKLYDQWYITYHHRDWYTWLSDTGLKDATFSTRRSVLDVLEQTLKHDGLLDATAP